MFANIEEHQHLVTCFECFLSEILQSSGRENIAIVVISVCGIFISFALSSLNRYFPEVLDSSLTVQMLLNSTFTLSYVCMSSVIKHVVFFVFFKTQFDALMFGASFTEISFDSRCIPQMS